MWGGHKKGGGKIQSLKLKTERKKLQNKKSKTEKVFHFLKSSQ